MINVIESKLQDKKNELRAFNRELDTIKNEFFEVNICSGKVENAEEKGNRWTELDEIITELENEISDLEFDLDELIEEA